jgi:hypothetical protein
MAGEALTAKWWRQGLRKKRLEIRAKLARYLDVSR